MLPIRALGAASSGLDMPRRICAFAPRSVRTRTISVCPARPGQLEASNDNQDSEHPYSFNMQTSYKNISARAREEAIELTKKADKLPKSTQDSGNHQRPPTFFIRVLLVAAVVEEEPGQLGVPQDTGAAKGCLAAGSLLLDIRAGFEQ